MTSDATEIEESAKMTKSTTCYLRTKKGNFKSFNVSVNENTISIYRPDSSKQHEFNYQLNTVQCVFGEKLSREKSQSLHCLQLVG